MAKGDILLSPKHGVNPSMMQCFFCGEVAGIALLGKLKGDIEAPRQAVFDKQPCAKCADLMKQGIMFIQVRNGESGDNPYRTGPVVVIKQEAFDRMGIQPLELRVDILRKRVAFLEKATWDYLGLPEGDINEGS
jgi:hypothetical protein